MDCGVSSNEINGIIDLLDKSIDNLKDLDSNTNEKDLKSIEYLLIKTIINIEFIRSHMAKSEDKNELESVKNSIEKVKNDLNNFKNISEKIDILENNKALIKDFMAKLVKINDYNNIYYIK